MSGLGVRDLLAVGDDLLILAGPTMAHDGPTGIWRWRNGAKEGASADPGDITQVLALPQVESADRAEDMALLDDASLLVVFDAPSDARRIDARTVLADVFRLP